MLNFLYTAVSWVLLRWHALFSFIGISEGSGLNWALSIVFLVITARLLLVRLFIKQVHHQRRMQEMQPRMTAIRDKYKNDRAAQQRELMKLQQDEGFNPIAGCLPMLLQFPIFISLFHVLRHLSNSVGIADKLAAGQSLTSAEKSKLTLYSFTQGETTSAAKAKLFNAPLAGSLRDSVDTIHKLGGEIGVTRIVIVALVVISAAATYMTQRLVRSAATTVPVGTAATVQNLMLYLIPLGTLGSGLFFPLGVLLYWFTSNTWTMGQQLYINKYHPHTPTETPVTGALGRTLAPKPGAKPKPNLNKDRQPAQTDSAEPADPSSGSGSGGANGLRPSTPRPGQRPNRPGSNRPGGGKRPNQAKKRR